MRSTRLTRSLAMVAAAAALAVFPAPARALAQETPSTAAAADPTAGPPITAAPAAQVSSGLPAQSAPPRTLRAHWHVFIAFALVWVLVFGYMLTLGQRFRKLETELNALRGGAS